MGISDVPKDYNSSNLEQEQDAEDAQEEEIDGGLLQFFPKL